MGIRIKSVHAREVFGRQLYPAVETTVVTDSGASGTAIVASGASIGTHESAFVFDSDRFEGKGVTRAVANVNDIIAPALIVVSLCASYSKTLYQDTSLQCQSPPKHREISKPQQTATGLISQVPAVQALFSP